jgi:hypothetical protein
MKLYQIRKDGYSEYFVSCPLCFSCFEIHQTHLGREMKKNKECNRCQYVLPVNNVYVYICESSFIYRHIDLPAKLEPVECIPVDNSLATESIVLRENNVAEGIPCDILSLYKAYYRRDNEFELNIYRTKDDLSGDENV